ncbi:hypothetical protein ACFLY6_02425 [Candidatus Dependentiae bacterium]
MKQRLVLCISFILFLGSCFAPNRIIIVQDPQDPSKKRFFDIDKVQYLGYVPEMQQPEPVEEKDEEEERIKSLERVLEARLRAQEEQMKKWREQEEEDDRKEKEEGEQSVQKLKEDISKGQEDLLKQISMLAKHKKPEKKVNEEEKTEEEKQTQAELEEKEQQAQAELEEKERQAQVGTLLNQVAELQKKLAERLERREDMAKERARLQEDQQQKEIDALMQEIQKRRQMQYMIQQQRASQQFQQQQAMRQWQMQQSQVVQPQQQAPAQPQIIVIGGGAQTPAQVASPSAAVQATAVAAGTKMKPAGVSAQPGVGPRGLRPGMPQQMVGAPGQAARGVPGQQAMMGQGVVGGVAMPATPMVGMAGAMAPMGAGQMSLTGTSAGAGVGGEFSMQLDSLKSQIERASAREFMGTMQMLQQSAERYSYTIPQTPPQVLRADLEKFVELLEMANIRYKKAFDVSGKLITSDQERDAAGEALTGAYKNFANKLLWPSPLLDDLWERFFASFRKAFGKFPIAMSGRAAEMQLLGAVKKVRRAFILKSKLFKALRLRAEDKAIVKQGPLLFENMAKSKAIGGVMKISQIARDTPPQFIEQAKLFAKLIAEAIYELAKKAYKEYFAGIKTITQKKKDKYPIGRGVMALASNNTFMNRLSVESQSEISRIRDKINTRLGHIPLSKEEELMMERLDRAKDYIARIGIRSNYPAGCQEIQTLIAASKFNEKDISAKTVKKVFDLIDDCRDRLNLRTMDRFKPGRTSHKKKPHFFRAFSNLVATAQKKPYFRTRLQRVYPKGNENIAEWQRYLMKKGFVGKASGGGSAFGVGMGGMMSPMGGMGMMPMGGGMLPMGGGMYGGGMRY